MRFIFAILCLPFSCLAWEEIPSQRSGKYQVSLRLPADGLYAGDEMQIEYRVEDTSRVDPLMGAAPVIRAATKSVISMPLMKSMPSLEEAAHPEGIPGEYGVHPLFPHGGEYVLDLVIKPPADAEFMVRFLLNVRDQSQQRLSKPKPKPYTMELKSSPKSPKAGEPVELAITFHHRDRPKEVFQDFVIQHEKLIHLLIVRSDLGVFSHEHPVISSDGVFRITYTFPTAGEFHLFGDVAPKGAGSQVLLTKLKVLGKAAQRFDVSKAERKPMSVVDDMTVEFAGSQKQIGTRKTQTLMFKVTDTSSGKPVKDIQLYLGAMGHLILIHEDGVTFVHSHPDERSEDAGKDGTVPFLARFPKPGLYRGWSQFQRNGRVHTADFVISAMEEAP